LIFTQHNKSTLD